MEEVNERLVGQYGDPEEMHALKMHSTAAARNHEDGSDEAVDVLVETVLSQNTTDKNSHRAFLRVKRRWPHWRLVLTCDERDLADEIRCGGLANTKAARIKQILRLLCEREGRPCDGSAEPTLHFVDPIADNNEALATLQQLPGVGPKTAACTLLFGLGRQCFPVDTHIFRIARRLGLSAQRTHSAVQQELEDVVPPHLKMPLHLLIIEHGRHVCTAQRAMCGQCVLADLCPTGQKHTKKRRASGEPPPKRVKTEVAAKDKHQEEEPH